MKTNDFYEVDGCMDFIPVKIVGKSEDGVIVTHTNDKRDCQLVVEEVYRLPKPHEPQKVTVPKFVAEWIETHKRWMPFLSHLFTDNLDEQLKEWLDFSDNQNLMAKAWLYGYTVEKEPLYTVEIPNPNSNAHTILRKTEKGIVLVAMANARWNGWEESKLTESEIKQDFEWAFQFAKPVEVDND